MIAAEKRGSRRKERRWKCYESAPTQDERQKWAKANELLPWPPALLLGVSMCKIRKICEKKSFEFVDFES